MGDRVARRAGPAVRAAVWTAAVAATLYAADRTLIGPRPASGWIEAGAIEDVPVAIGPVAIPAYLPDSLAWPPARVLYRTADATGWWLGISSASGDRVSLWIGSSRGPIPEALGAAAGCVDAAPRTPCPEPWHALSAPHGDDQTVYVLTTLDGTESKRILERLD